MEDRIDFAEAIASQPTCMRRAHDLAAAAWADRSPRPWPGSSVAVVGMGASTHAGLVFVEALRAAGIRAVNLDASAAAAYPEGFRPAETTILISESGRSPEPIAAGKRMGGPHIVITNDPDSPIAELADVLVPLGGFKDSGVYTIGYTTTLVALAVTAEAHGVKLADPPALPSLAAEAWTRFDESARPLAAQLAGRTFLDCVATGPSLGSAAAAALLFREATATPTAWHETAQALHGPMECWNETTAVLTFGEGKDEHHVAAEADRVGALSLHLPTTPGFSAAVTEILYAQTLARHVADLRGMEVGKFRLPQPQTKLK
jgi:fructoselysine-6-P-deglycase FrlB-like protein